MIIKFFYYKWVVGACRHFCFFCKHKQICHEENFRTNYKLIEDFANWLKHNR